MLLPGAVCALAFVAVAAFFLRTEAGQRTDDASLAGSVLGRDRIISEVQHVLDLVSVSALVIAALVAGTIGIARRRPRLALFALLLLATTNVTTRLLKKTVLHRPNLGIDGVSSSHANTLPSGHTTVAMSVSIALLFVVPRVAQWAVALIGAVASAGMGIATLSAGWHRPSDAIAAYLVVGVWTAVLAAATRGPGHRAPDRRPPAFTSTLWVLGVTGGLAWIAGIIGLVAAGGQTVDTAGRHHLFAAYAGGAAAVAGTALLVMCALLAVADTMQSTDQPTTDTMQSTDQPTADRPTTDRPTTDSAATISPGPPDRQASGTP